MKHLVLYSMQWESEYPWLIPKKDHDRVVGILCSMEVLANSTIPKCGVRLLACARTVFAGIA